MGTQPCRRMREAMANAVVGDVVIGDDPTVKALEEEAAEVLGKEKALFVASGTMGNLITVASHCGRGDEVILGQHSHILTYEAANLSAHMGIGTMAVQNQENGSMDPSEIAGKVQADDPH